MCGGGGGGQRLATDLFGRLHVDELGEDSARVVLELALRRVLVLLARDPELNVLVAELSGEEVPE